MRSKGSAAELERTRRLAVRRVLDRWKQTEVAEFLGVSTRAVTRWVAAHRAGGEEGLRGKPHPGPAPRLSPRQEGQVLSWLARKPSDFGFPTQLWTSRRLAGLIEKRLGVRFNPNYLCEWLRRRGFSPQKPEVHPRERDEAAVREFVGRTWPAFQKRHARSVRTSC